MAFIAVITSITPGRSVNYNLCLNLLNQLLLHLGRRSEAFSCITFTSTVPVGCFSGCHSARYIFQRRACGGQIHHIAAYHAQIYSSRQAVFFAPRWRAYLASAAIPLESTGILDHQ